MQVAQRGALRCHRAVLKEAVSFVSFFLLERPPSNNVQSSYFQMEKLTFSPGSQFLSGRTPEF